MEVDPRPVQALMRRIDECYALGGRNGAASDAAALDQLLDLEQELERRLWILEHYLEALDEDEDLLADDGSPDGEVGVEEQFVALWHAYVSGSPSFGGDVQNCEMHLLDVLQGACLGGMSPGRLRVDSLPSLLPIARELALARQALIARYRAHSRRWGH